jgi:hypothetical protein
MKIGGVELKGPNEEVLVLPRLSGNIVIRAQAVTDMSAFDAMVPVPKAPGIRTKDGFKPDTKDVTYQAMQANYSDQRMAYIVIKSIELSEIEWSKVSLADPTTWLGWQTELKEAGLSEIECNRIVICVMQANSLDEDKLRSAREVFLRGQAM